MTKKLFHLITSVATQACGLLLALAAMATHAVAGPNPPGVPEIDPGSLASAVALFVGGALMLTDRIRRR
jgi:hypothetical protein